MNNWERMKAGRLYNADSKDLEQYHKFGRKPVINSTALRCGGKKENSVC